MFQNGQTCVTNVTANATQFLSLYDHFVTLWNKGLNKVSGLSIPKCKFCFKFCFHYDTVKKTARKQEIERKTKW